MDLYAWHQVNLAFPDRAQAERTVAVDLAPVMAAACADKLIASWFFIRKTPCWRVRYLPLAEAAAPLVHGHLDALQRQGRIAGVTEVIYEPEQRAFGGADGMQRAHHLFHADSQHFLAYLADDPAAAHRREISIMLCSVLLREAELDWYEQGDVWARVAEHRDLPAGVPPGVRHALEADMPHLMRATSSLRGAPGWFDAFAAAGRDLASLAADGRLHRGLRDVLAHHIIFAWNRHGLTAHVQAALAHCAAAVVFGVDPTTEAAS